MPTFVRSYRIVVPYYNRCTVCFVEMMLYLWGWCEWWWICEDGCRCDRNTYCNS